MAQIKTKEQIRKIKKACKITDDIFSLLLKQDLKNMTEIELRDVILQEIKRRGLKPSFPPIVTSGKQAGDNIHPEPTKKKLAGFVIIDMGVIYEKFMSDMTRTIFVGTPSKKEQDLYTMVLKGQLLGIQHAMPGVTCAYVDEVVRESFGVYKEYFIHTLGHGVGTKIHELPHIYYKLPKPILKESMTITIEPGIYIKQKCGIRIEDTCVVTKKGCIPLCSSSKELIVIV